MTPKQIVGAVFPKSYASFQGDNWFVYSRPMRPAPRGILPAATLIGMGYTAPKAWSDALRRIRNREAV
jgi:hypothetical protein